VVIRYLEATGEAYGSRAGGDAFSSFGFWLGREHPVYEIVSSRTPRLSKPYAWYLRLADIPTFIRHIAPALEKSLGSSPFAGHSGELKLTFFRSGLKLTLEKGRLAGVDAWKPEPNGFSGDVSFPDLTFLQLLFGYRSLDELGHAFADCRWGNDNTHGLMNALFPKQASHVLAVT
jgi:hypothetical protein